MCIRDRAEQGEEEERPQHVELAVGEVDHAHDAEDQGEADAHEGVAAPDDEAVDDVLDELRDHAWTQTRRPAPPSRARRPPPGVVGSPLTSGPRRSTALRWE